MSGKRSLRLLAGFWLALLLPGLAGAADLANARLLIAGSRLTVSPESQTVPFDTPTIVDTHIEGYDVERGVLPKDLRVVGDFTGPEVNGILVLETVPNQPFRIPRLRLEGQYRLDNIRLMQGNDLLAYAEPRSAGVLVTQVLITKVTSRALTLDEIRSYGIVVNDDSFQAFNFTFAFAVAGETVNYNIPVIYMGPAKDPYILWDGLTNFDAPAWRSSSVHFEPPRMAPFQLSFDNGDTGDGSFGGCEAGDGDCSKSEVVPIPGVILFPTDVSLLHQFFSVMLIAQNGAPAGDRLEIHDLTAKVTLPPGLRQAKTDPPTPLGVPVPVRVPGPDGKLGTADDLTFLVAQASGQAEVQVEGLREGTHIVQFDLEGVLHGLADGKLRRVTGTAKGAVIVRDPTLNVTITHPDVVRTDEEYSMLLTVTNTGTAPANLLKVRLPLDKLTGVEVVGVNEKTVTILPGDAELVEFRLRSKRTGRVVASAVRSSTEITPTFELTVGVGENGIPLSPSSIILPRAADSLPPDLVRNGLNLIGLGFSLATAPPSLLRTDLPRVSRSMVDNRVYQLAQAGRQVAFGENLFDSAAELAADWNGARDGDWEWDLLRRTTQKGSWVGASLGTVFAAEAATSSPRQAFERFAKTTGYLPPLQGALATGTGVSLEVASRTGGQRLRGGGNDTTRLRELPFADLYMLASDAQMAVMTVPEAGGYEARLRASTATSADLHVLVPGADGALRVATWENVPLAAGGTAVLTFKTSDSSFVLQVDTQGDGTVDSQITGSIETLQRRPFQALAAVLNTEVDPTGHVVDVLFTTDVDPSSLAPADPRHFTIPNKVSNGGWVQSEDDVIDGSGNTIVNPFKGLRNSRIIQVIFNNPLSPYAPQDLTVAGVKNPLGEQVVSTSVRVTVPSNAMPGTLVQGKVYGPDGNPVPFAEVELRESDRCLFCEESCRTHKTAVVRADSSGSFLFDYVRQTDCSDIYQLKGIDAATGRSGTATGRVRFIGQVAQLNVVMLGRGTIRGRVTYDDGTVPPEARVIAESPVFREGVSARPDANGNFSVSDVAVGTITLSANDGLGRFVVKTVAVPEAGSVVQFDLVILRQPAQPVANGVVRGVIYRPDGTTPVAGAYVALYTDGNLVGTRNSGADGTFDFGSVPAGRGEIETFEGQTGQSGVQVFFTINPDQVNPVNLIMRDQRGVVQGYVYKKVNGSNVPMFGVIVWAEGTPFKTVTDPQGHYVLEGVFAGTRNISAADLDKKVKLSEAVTIGSEGQVVDKNFYFEDASILGGIAGEVLGFDGGPVVGATVHLAADDQHWFRTATTDSSGRFTIPNLGVGGYGVHAFKGASGGSTGALVRFVGDTPFVSIRFKKGSIHGVVQAENDSGQPVGITALVTYRTTAVRLELVGLDLEAHTITTAADGTWSIPDALVGPYVITVSNSFYGSKTIRGELVNNGESQTQNVLFERNVTGTIKGRVLDQDGVTPVQGAHVELKHPTLANDMLTNADGQFSFELLPPSPWGFPVDVTWENGVVFRKAEVWVNFSQKGQNLDLEIVLPKQGSISGRVSDANGVLVPGSVVTLQEGSYPRRTLVSNADVDGNFEFHNIFAGTVTLSARAPSLGGLGGKTTVEIKADGEDVAGVTIFLEPTGKIQGRITNPSDGSPAASAQVQLLRYGYLFDSIDTDADGKFEFDLLPMATYDVQALDPRTGRHGRRNGLQLTQNNQVLQGDFQLETRGAVDGHLYEPGSTVAIPGATVRLGSNGFVSFNTYSSTGADGYFEFLGIPQGRFDLFSREPGGRRVANGHGEIVTEGQRVTQDLFLERQGTVNGSVLNPLGSPDGVFPNANTVLQQDGLNVGATLESTYSFTGVILGHPFWLETQEIGGPHRGETWGNLTDVGPVKLDVRIHPMGSVVVNVRDSFGNPVNAATVEVVNDGFYGWKRFNGDTGTDNAITFQGLGEGRITAYATNPATGLRGSATGVLAQEGQIVQVNLTLENSAQIKGTVVTADGTTPAPNALVALQIAGRTLTTFTNDAGFFTLPSVPMGSYLLVFQESFGPGSREIRGSLSTNGQVLDLGTVVLDAVNPKVTEIVPANGAIDLPLNTQPVVRFSEAMDPTRNLVANVVHIETASGNWVGSTNTWIDGNTAIRMVPYQPLQNFTTYRIKATAEQLFDVSGRRLDQSVQTSFTTADVLPPVIIEVNPANNAKQVSLAAQIRVMFNEPVDMFTLSGTHMVLQDLTAASGVTTTFQLDSAGRTVTVNPISALIDGHAYQLTLQGVADRVGNAMTAPFVTTFYTVDTTPPVISNVLPADGTTFTSGDRMTVSATVVDPAGVTSVALSTGRWVLLDNQAPYSWNVPAPIVTTPTDVALQLEAVDAWGNHVASIRTVHILPRTNAHAPQVTLGCFARHVVPGAELDLPFHVTDDEGVESYKLTVNGTTTLADVPLADSADVTASAPWTVPSSAAAGDVMTLHLEAHDFAGNVASSDVTVTVAAGVALKGDRTLTDIYAGQTLFLSKGTVAVTAPLHVGGLILQGVTLKSVAGGTVDLTAGGVIEVACGSTIDVTGQGYAAGSGSHTDGYAPAGVTGSTSPAAGGSHGGRGGNAAGGVAGEVYDSVYAPRQGGGGGGSINNLNLGSAGGGAVRISAGELMLAGQIRARGTLQPSCNGGAGAGGTVAITAGVVGGAGSIDASGGDTHCPTVITGGGGRVSIVTGTWNGFDPTAQAKAWGGGPSDGDGTSSSAPGTIYYKQTGDTYGSLLIDAGEIGGVDRSSLVTELPALGSGAVTATQVAGADLWVTSTAGFAPKWLGVWVHLRSSAGVDLGVFPVAEIDGAGRLRLAGAAAVTGAATWLGEYRFDRMDLRNGAGVQTADPVVGPELVLDGNAEVSGAITAANVRIKSGAVVRPATGGELRIVTPGRLTVEAGARLDVSGLGYAPGSGGHLSGYTPDGVTGSTSPTAGGSHGGRGGNAGGGVAGEVYDSVYTPSQAGAGGASNNSLNLGTAGGGVVHIEAGEVALAGEIRARGALQPSCNGGAGAGGTVSILAGVVSGAGSIDASGADTHCPTVITGGGGRVSIVTGTWSGFDPLTQVKAWGGSGSDGTGTSAAAPGTIYYRKTGDTYGALLIDAGEVSGVDRSSLATELPLLGGGTVTATEVAGGDLWVSASPGFLVKWLGAWMRLKSSAGADLGAFQVAEVDGAGRVRLTGAAAVTGASSYQGEYRFDRVELKNGAGVDAQDPLASADTVFDGGAAALAGEVTGATAEVLAGATVRPARGGELRLTLTGKLTLASGALLDVSGTGYAAGSGSHTDGFAPAGVTGSTSPKAGGSHGGRGGNAGGGVAGEVYDSVYGPSQSGGGGASVNNLNLGSAGGGVVRITAGELALGGEIRARGTLQASCNGGAGAGGTVSIAAGVVSGTGTVDASGGDTHCPTVITGGGGRVSIVTGTWNGFDPVAQVKAWGGAPSDGTGTSAAAPGTIYYRQASDTYGALLVDSGKIGGVDRVSLTTDLPTLGGGTLTATQVAGGDLWVSAGTPFAAKWLGVWVHLLNAGGTDLGVFPVAEIDGAGRLRLQGAAGAASPVTFKGEYRFDRIDFKSGAGLRATDPIVGPELVLEGNAQVSGAITATNVRVKSGAVVSPASGEELRIITPGRLTIEAGARLDVSGRGYAAGSGSHLSGYTPDGVTGSTSPTAGGSHGGRGGNAGGGVAGEVYDSVYTPSQSGAGGASINNLNPGSAGGGVVHIEAGEVALAGEIRARGALQPSCNGGAGAGGTVSILAGVVSGAGSIDASGADTHCPTVITGGGGRVSIVTGTWSGFDPLTQVKAWGGSGSDGTGTSAAAPGTIYYRKTGDTYGALLIDAGEVSGVDRASLATELPLLGGGTVTATDVAGGDLWVSASPGFLAKWLGSWMRLKSSAGAGLGAFQVAEVDGAGRVRLTGAAAVTGASTYQGEYRFDRVELKNGAGVDAQDPLASADTVFDGGAAALAGEVTGATAEVLTGSTVRPARGGELRLTLTGKLTLASGALLDVSGTGYAAGSGSHTDGYAPAGVTGSTSPKAGGSHGGRGGEAGGGVAGEVYDSVYGPSQSGGGGASVNNLNLGSAGGGVVRITAGEVALAGEIRARGALQASCNGGAGAGGTVSIAAGVVSGVGLVDASGGDTHCPTVITGGGGRVSIVTGTWNGFDPASQVKAWGGGPSDGTGTSAAAPGTIYYRQASDTYGALLVDAGEISGVDRTGSAAELPVLGSGSITATQAADGDLWVSSSSAFAAKWLGVWVHLSNAAGTDLGAFPVAEIDGAGRIRLAGAAGAVSPVTFKGEYRFDRVELKNGAGLDAKDLLASTDTVFDSGDAELVGEVKGATAKIASGAVVRPARGSELRLTLTGKLTIETGARLDVSGQGYAAGAGSHVDGFAPAGVTGSTSPSAGGSHGGRGANAGGGVAGEVYDSLFAPTQAGGGGAAYNNLNIGTAGGGVVHVEAGELALAGEIRARGAQQPSCYGAGAGGTVAVVAGVVSGAGTIDASGGDTHCGTLTTGGGGRVSIVTGTWSGFDPASQVKAWGGSTGDGAGTSAAAPGTIFYKKTGDTYGALLIDAGEVGGVDRVGAAAELPVLGGGAVTATAVSGSDLWVSSSAGFLPKWVGAWMRLKSSAGADLGAFAVAELDGGGRLRLAGAAGVTTAASYQGEYRFDRVELKNGAGVDAQDPVASADTVFDSGDAELAGEVTGATAEVLAGSVVRPARGGELRLTLTGKLTVASGARLDVAGAGYAAGNASHLDGYAPAGVAGSTGAGAGGSHGGRGGQTGAGEVYDSLYSPSLAGGGGAAYNSSNFGSAGGGVVRLTAGEVALAGQIVARGGTAGCYGGIGAGGTVAIVAGVVSGAGTIDASGADTCNSAVYSGAGGRVSIVTGTWSGFDPAAQVKAWGGANSNGGFFASPGTIFYKKTGDTYGSLLVDQGASSGTAGTTVPTSIGKGIVGAVYTESGNATALWIEPQDSTRKFDLGVVGMWVRINGTDYAVIAQSGDRRRLLLAGAAGAVSVGDSYLGIYKFDTVTVKGRASLQFADGAVIGSSSAASGSTLTLYDLTPPTVTVTQPTAGTEYTSGQTVPMAATVTDDRGVASVTFRLGDQSSTVTASPYSWSVAAPTVTTEGDMPITVDAVDTNDNHTTVTRLIHMRPLAPGAAPAVAFTCPTAGVLLAPSTGIDLNVAASHDNGIERVEFYQGSTLLSTDFQAPFAYHFTLSAGATDGQVVTITARAKSFTGTTADATLDIHAVVGSTITADRTVSATDTSLDNTSVVVAGGTLTISGAHTFRDLVILDGAKLTHPETTSTLESKLDLTVQRDVYVSCTGAVDVTGRGFLGSSSSSARAYGFGNVQTEGASPGIGGGYGGRGGQYDGSSPVYGSFYDPRDSGAGGGYSGAKGRDGGGVVRITATGNAVIDGSVLANGETGTSGAGGAGGSIRLNGAAIRGAGLLQASGSAGAGGTAGGGSGGRIALYGAAIDSGLLGRTLAAGGKTSATDPATWGAAGTIFVKPDAQSLGDLILDNAGTASTQYTELLVVGHGVIDAVATNGFTDNEADFRSFLGAAEVAFNGDFNTLYTILSHSHHGTSLTLNVPTPPLTSTVHVGDTYDGIYRFHSVTVRNGAKGIALDRVDTGNTPGSAWTAAYAPSVQLTSPTAGASITSGTNFTAAVSLQDVLGVKSVTFTFNGQSTTVTASPYSTSMTAPAVTVATDFTVAAAVVDLSGNRFATSLTVHVQPVVDPNAPVVTLGACPASGDLITPGVALTIPFTAVDDQSIQSYSLVVDGTTQQTVTANQATVSSSFTWTPPSGAALGTTFTVRIEARDFGGGVGFATLTLAVPPVAALTGTQNLTTARNGQDVYLGAGTFTVQSALSLASLNLMNGAKVVGLSGQTLSLTVAGATRIQCGGLLDLSNLGYLGGQASNTPGSAPTGITASSIDAGGSHGGYGSLGQYSGPAGDIYDNIYLPFLGGGGGSMKNCCSVGGAGGGVLSLTSGSVLVNGEIRSRGEKRQTTGYTDSSGAGGSIVITAATTLSGTGLIDASGGDYQASGSYGGSGGGGRVALYTDTMPGFDPVTQVKAWGGAVLNNTTPQRYAGPGTVFVKKTGDTYGRLIVDAGKETNGTERIGPQTLLTGLGSGTLTGFTAQGSDALVSTAAGFLPRWTGAWMALDDAAGNNLGAFKVLSVDSQSRALLQGAASATTATKFRGQYRFDRLDVKSGAGVSSSDELVVTNAFAESKGRLPASLTATNLTVKAGSPVTLAVGGDLKINLSGRLTVESGAVLDVTGRGYLGGQASNTPGTAPAGVTAAGYDAGGSHGGYGSLGQYTGPLGDVYGTVYQPTLGGGGGSMKNCCSVGGSGGGTVSVTASEVVLDGEIRAKGEKRQTTGYTDSSGAGGSVLITATTLSGAGLIDASGGDYQASGSYGGSGGGGRVALYVGTFSGFDPAAQVKAWGGTVYNGTTVVRYAGPGTVLTRTSGQTYGRLIVDAGKESNGTERVGAQTPLPVLGTGTVTAFAAQGLDGLVTASAAFKAPWVGAWMALDDASGTVLGSYPVLSIDSSGRALLKGAASATTAAKFRGQYRFDRLDVKSGAGVSSSDELLVTDAFAESKGRLPSSLTATNLTVKAGSAVTLAVGGDLKINLSGRLTVESGALLDVTGRGYLGGQASNTPGTAPAGVTAAGVDAGGSHGGFGSLGQYTGPLGDIYGTVYRPTLGGGGGSMKNCCSVGGSGGGTVSVTASEVVLDGEIRAKGEKRQTTGYTDSSGGGGSVLITAATMSGAGLIDASGGDYQASGSYGGSGGGGRVALYVDAFSGFDPAAQVKAWGGAVYNNTTPQRYGGPGTVFTRTFGQVYGRLIVDAGKETGGAERVGAQTPLPVLGTGAVTAFTVQGADGLVTASAVFKAPWVGAWMALVDSSGASLGSFPVLSIDSSGRILLQGAAAATTAAQYRGQYRFDRVDVKSGAGVSSSDEVIVGDLYAESKGRIPSNFTAANVTIKAGSPVTLAVGGDLKLTVSSRLKVETGGVLDVTGKGYLGGQASNTPGSAPSGVTASAVDAGGSHGGVGSLGQYTGPAGEVYGNVYGPRLGGGGGSMKNCCSVGGAGGGTMLLNVNELVVDGEIRARGEKRQTTGYSDSSGAGGSVLITATTMSGAGLIDASGGDYQASGSYGGSGGGGRVALYVDTLTGFDPATQVLVRGGAVLNNTTVQRWASPGTAFLKQPQMTYGKLYVDQGGISAKPIPNSPLPAIGVGTVGTVTTDTVNTANAWIEPSDSTAKFALGAVGMWVRINSTDYLVVDQSADRRKLLLGGAAGAVSTGNGYRGVYKFDEVIVRGGSKLEFRDTNAVGTFTVDGTSSVIQNVP